MFGNYIQNGFSLHSLLLWKNTFTLTKKQAWSLYKHTNTPIPNVSNQPTKDGMATKTRLKDWKKWKKS